MFIGINRSKLDIIGTFTNKMGMIDFEINIQFYVLSDGTMIHGSVLGRDFVSLPILEINFGKYLEAKKLADNH